MQRKIDIQKYAIISLSIALILVVIGFLFVMLKCNSIKQKEAVFDYKITSIKQTSSIKGSEIEPKAKVNIINDRVADLTFNLFSGNDEISYDIIVENIGTEDIELVDIMTSPDYTQETFKNIINPVSIKISLPTEKVIKTEEKAIIKLMVKYPLVTGNQVEKNFNIKISLIVRSNKK